MPALPHPVPVRSPGRLGRGVGLLGGAALVASLLAVPGAAVAAGGALEFSEPVASALLPAPQRASGMVTADVDLDGVPDVLVASSDNDSGTAPSGRLSVLLSRSGALGAPADFPAGQRALGVAAGDVDGDGVPDVVTTTFDGMNVLSGNGDGTFDAPVHHRAGQLRQPVVADFDGDGRLDVAAPNYYHGSFFGALDVLRNVGDGTFALSRIELGQYSFPTRLTSGDLDLDGDLDLLTSSNGSFYVVLGNGDGTFADPVHHTWSYTNFFGQAGFSAHLTDVAVGDFDTDGLPDVAAASSNDTAAGLWFFPGNGDGTLALSRAVSRRVGGAGETVTTADFEGDGRLDVAVGTGNGPHAPAVLSVRTSSDPWPSLGYQAPGGYVFHQVPASVAAADVSGDARPDLLTLDAQNHRVLVRTQATSAPPPDPAPTEEPLPPPTDPTTSDPTPPPSDPTPPSVSIYSPAAGASYEEGLSVLADYSCFDDVFVVSCEGTVPWGEPVDTTTVGTRSFTVEARDDQGTSTSESVSYQVTAAQAPTIAVTTPQEGASYEQFEQVWVDYVCDDASGIELCYGSDVDWQLDTSTLGPNTFTVDATDLAGHTAQVTVSYEVVPPGPVDTTLPTIRISSPVDGATYEQNDLVVATYECEDLESGIASCSGPVPTGSLVDTQTSGYRTFTVYARDVAGNHASRSVSYYVEAGPPPPDTAAPYVLFNTPGSNARYATGSSLTVEYSCHDYGTGATGVATCTGTLPNGAALDTSVPGLRSFSVTTSDQAGNTRTTSITYEVIDDRDGDGIRDLWETQGIDIDQDGTVDLPLHEPPYNADPDRRDLFLEMDYMTCTLNASGCPAGDRESHAPQPGVVEDLVTAFAAAPVVNPDGSTGITMHYLVDEAVPEIQEVHWYRSAGAYDDVEDVKSGPDGPCNGAFGTAADRSAPSCDQLLRAKNQVYRWGLFGHFYAEYPGSSGIAEYPGNDFIVTVGGSAAAWERSAGSLRAAESGTVMHELGHNLHLGHGGPRNNQNCKPNYLSVMNYSFQVPSLDPTRPLDYSSRALPSLDEAALDEALGVQGPAGRYAVYGYQGSSFVVPADAPIDWNRDGATGGVVAADVDWTSQCDGGDPGPLTGADDWTNLKYSFYSSPDYASGSRTTSTVLLEEEMTSKEALASAESVDFDADGASNADDTCPAVSDPSQGDLDGDGTGDACDPVSTVGIRVLPEKGSTIRTTHRYAQVAVLSTARLVPGDVDRSSLRFGRTGTEVPGERCVTRDVDADSRVDLVCLYPLARSGLRPGPGEAVLTGRTRGGVGFSGSARVTVVR